MGVRLRKAYVIRKRAEIYQTRETHSGDIAKHYENSIGKFLDDTIRPIRGCAKGGGGGMARGRKWRDTS